MGLFDLSDFESLKTRADESAKAPQELSFEVANVNWNGASHEIKLQTEPLDGIYRFVSFSPPERPNEKFFVGSTLGSSDVWNGVVPQALRVFEQARSHNTSWQQRAVEALESGSFGRLRARENSDASATYDYFGSTGYAFSWDYIEYDDGLGPIRAAMASPEYDPQSSGIIWCEPREAKQLLLELDEEEVFGLLDAPDDEVGESVRLSRRWPKMTHEERRAFLPPVEPQIEAEVRSLMRAVLWSDPHWDDAQFAARHADFRALWRHPRFCIAAHESTTHTDLQTNLGFDLGLIERRRMRVFNAIIRRMEAFVKDESATFPPCAASWMRVRGGYIIEIGAPTLHEHLESRLLLRDFLSQNGESLEALESQ